jgi:hypothetical protein
MADTVKLDSIVTASAAYFPHRRSITRAQRVSRAARRLTAGSAMPMRVYLTRGRIGGREFPRGVHVVLAPTRVAVAT